MQPDSPQFSPHCCRGFAAGAHAPSLSEFQALELDAVGADLGQIVVRLLREPGCGAAAEDFGEADRHLGDIPRFSLTSSESVVRVTPRAAAASVMLNPIGSMHWRSTKPPGCGGFFIGISKTPSVIVDIINVGRVGSGKAKNHAPVRTHCHCPKAFEVSLERM